MSKSKIDRDKIISGEVTRVEDVNVIYRNNQPITSLQELRAKITVKEVKTYRSILFTVTADKKGKDLLYSNQPNNYPVLDLNNKRHVRACINADLFINGAYNLGPLLKHFGYPKYLSEKQIPEIRTRFFTGRFGIDHCELFGLEEIVPEEFIAAKSEEGITDPKQILTEYKKHVKQGAERTFRPSEEPAKFPLQLMWILDSRGKNAQKDPFMPTIAEGNIYMKRKI